MSEKLSAEGAEQALNDAADRVVRRTIERHDIPWSVKTTDERIEILRQEVRALRVEIEALGHGVHHVSSDHYKLREEFGRHRHLDQEQEVVVPVQASPYPMGVAGQSIRGLGRKDPLA